ncbi:MAG: GNAT family N-acetyltransferase [Myxococcota bacterium]
MASRVPRDSGPITVRPARVDDLEAMGRLGGDLVRTHHALDAQRFMLPDDVDEGYRWWFGKELANRKAHLLVAEAPDGSLVGYAYARMEPRDWAALRDRCAVLHDILVVPGARRHGVARLLLDAVAQWARERGAPRLVLHTASGNEAAQALFRGAGFRPTMVEMTLELDEE